jgi:hypothetical protein
MARVKLVCRDCGTEWMGQSGNFTDYFCPKNESHVRVESELYEPELEIIRKLDEIASMIANHLGIFR